MGKNETRGSNIPLSEFAVTKLAETHLGCGRNIITDNSFISISLAKKLLAKKTTLVGTIRANRKELPKIAKTKKDKITQFSTKLHRSGNSTLTIYKSKSNKKVLLLSTKHKNKTMEKNKKTYSRNLL